MSRFNASNSQACNVMTLFDGIVIKDGSWFSPIGDRVNIVGKKTGTGTVKFDIQASADEQGDANLQFKTIQSVTIDNTTPLVSTIIADPWNVIRIVPTQIDAGITSFISKLCN